MQTKTLMRQAAAILVAGLMCLVPLSAADDPAAAKNDEVKQLKQTVAEQQRQIDELRRMVSAMSAPQTAGVKQPEAQQPAASPQTETVLHPSTGEVASLKPIVPLAPVATAAAIPAVPLPQVPQEPSAAARPTSPLQIKIGDAYITPVGFMDFTSVTRNVTTGSSIGSNFGNFPYPNTPQANLSESRMSTQNSRIGLRVDAMVKGAKVLGYLESDFLGFVPANAAVTSNSDSLRIRLYWVDVRKKNIEFLGGQSWSMLTPSRRGIGALPGDLFYSQVFDTNYMNGLIWARQSGFRVLAHAASDKVTFGVALENAEQYVGGSGGGGVSVFPAALTSLAGSQFNNGTTTLNAPQLHPDIIAKVAFDPSTKFHFEIGGVERTFKDYIPATGATFSKAGGAGQINANIEIAKGLRLVTNNYYGAGGGRYIFGLAPDVILRPDGSISLVRSGSTVDGFEYTRKNTLLYAYYGGVYIGRNTAIDTNGNHIGYGFTGSSNAQNRTIHEATFGINQTFWKDAKYGALNFMVQYAYLTRNPWSVATGQPSSANDHTVWVDLRYTLPGSAPTLGE